jgi:hypothetical protein
VNTATASVGTLNTFNLNASAVAQAKGPTPLQQLLSGYPIPPSTGPALNGGMLVVKDPSVLVPLEGSTVALMPVTSISAGTSQNSTTYIFTFVDTSTGLTVEVPVTLVPATSSGSSGGSGSSSAAGSSGSSGGPTI